MLNYCVTRKQIKSNVARDATLKEAGDHRVILPSKKDRSLELLEEAICRVDPETILRIFQDVELQHRMKVKFAIETGLRAGEQDALKVYDKKTPKLGGVDFKNNVVRVRIAKKPLLLVRVDVTGIGLISVLTSSTGSTRTSGFDIAFIISSFRVV
jgi:hypothetical protein